MMNSKDETWYPLAEFPDSQYEINKSGQVRNTKQNQILKGTISKDGYLAYVLTINGKVYRRYAHVLTASQFIPNPENLPIVNHIDENKLNCHIDNLEWVTYSQNSKYGTAQERSTLKRSRSINEYSLNGEYIRTWKSAKEIYLFLGLPYDREHRTTYLVKILKNNEDPEKEKMVFAGRVFMYYNGNTEDIFFVIKKQGIPRNSICQELKIPENVPDKYTVSTENLKDKAYETLKQMQHYPNYSPAERFAIQYAIECIDKLNMILDGHESER